MAKRVTRQENYVYNNPVKRKAGILKPVPALSLTSIIFEGKQYHSLQQSPTLFLPTNTCPGKGSNRNINIPMNTQKQIDYSSTDFDGKKTLVLHLGPGELTITAVSRRINTE